MKRPVAYVAGTGRGIPAKVMTNHDFAALGLDTGRDYSTPVIAIPGVR